MNTITSKSLCLITNIGSHYRFPIFSEMAKLFACHFYLGDKVNTPIKRFDYNQLSGYQQTIKKRLLRSVLLAKGFGKVAFQALSLLYHRRRTLLSFLVGNIVVGQAYPKENHCMDAWMVWQGGNNKKTGKKALFLLAFRVDGLQQIRHQLDEKRGNT